MSGSAAPLGPADRELFERACEAAGRAYAPHSGISVGAAVRARDGTIITGANVENSSYPLGICAEQVALARAVAHGVRPGGVGSIASSLRVEMASSRPAASATCSPSRSGSTEMPLCRALLVRSNGGVVWPPWPGEPPCDGRRPGVVPRAPIGGR